MNFMVCESSTNLCFKNTMPFTIAPSKIDYLPIISKKMCIGSVSRKLQNAYERNKDLDKETYFIH